jgi:hypothetical protein
MDYTLVLVIVLLVEITIWLWRLGKEQMTDLAVATVLTPELEVTASPIPKPSPIEVWLDRTRDWLLRIFILLTLSLFLLGIAVSVYYLLVGQSRAALSTFGLTLLLLLGLNILLIRRRRLAEFVPTGPSTVLYRRIEYSGEATVPKKVYLGDSRNISVALRPTLWIPTVHTESFHSQDTESGHSVILQALKDSNLEQFLEVELLAAGVSVDGEKKQHHPLTSQILSYRWNCYFPNSGNHALALAFRVVSLSGSIEVGTIQHTIKVVKLDHLTQRQVWILASLAGIVSGGLTIAEVLHKLGAF